MSDSSWAAMYTEIMTIAEVKMGLSPIGFVFVVRIIFRKLRYRQPASLREINRISICSNSVLALFDGSPSHST